MSFGSGFDISVFNKPFEAGKFAKFRVVSTEGRNAEIVEAFNQIKVMIFSIFASLSELTPQRIALHLLGRRHPNIGVSLWLWP